MSTQDRQEQADKNAYKLQDEMGEAILNLEVEMPTVLFTSKKAELLGRTFNGDDIPHMNLQDIFTTGGWDTNPQHFDLLIWKHTDSAYLPFFFGSLDGRVNGLANTVIHYDNKTFDKGMRHILLRLDKIYRVLKYRNPTLLRPKAKKVINWEDKVSLHNNGPINYFYRWGKNIYTETSTPMISSSSSPSNLHINILQDRQPAFRYELGDHNFLFLPMSKSFAELPDLSNTVIDVTSILYGRPLKSCELWPRGLKSICFPMYAVEAMAGVYPLFNFLVEHKPQGNRQLNYYVLKEMDYLKFLGLNGGVKYNGDGSVAYLASVYGDEIVTTPRTVELVIDEVKLRSKASDAWEDYEEFEDTY